jgi:hypothetical protein
MSSAQRTTAVRSHSRRLGLISNGTGILPVAQARSATRFSIQLLLIGSSDRHACWNAENPARATVGAV